MQQLMARPTAEEIVPARGGATQAKRDRAIWKAHVQYGYSLATVGQHLGLHYTTISKNRSASAEQTDKVMIQDLTPNLTD